MLPNPHPLITPYIPPQLAARPPRRISRYMAGTYTCPAASNPNLAVGAPTVTENALRVATTHAMRNRCKKPAGSQRSG